MNQQRLQSYIDLIQKLLACPSGEEWILLRQNETLVTPELVHVIEQVATQLANQGNLKEAKFLHNLAGQIHHLFLAQTIQPSNDKDHSEAYLELIKALMECPKGTEEELLTVNQDLIGPGLVKMMQQVAAELSTSGDLETSSYLQYWAAELNRRWLQPHHFQPVLKQDAEPKHFHASPTATQPITPQIPFPSVVSVPQPIPVSQPHAAAATADEEDIWAELSDDAAQTERHALSTPQAVPAAPKPAVAVQAPVFEPLQPHLAANAPTINPYLETIAAALTKLSEALIRPQQPPTNPLWYMEVLERASAENWVLTSTEIQTLIGVHPTCPKGRESFQRGTWVFVKAGKVGTQSGWRVKKEQE